MVRNKPEAYNDIISTFKMQFYLKHMYLRIYSIKLPSEGELNFFIQIVQIKKNIKRSINVEDH